MAKTNTKSIRLNPQTEEEFEKLFGSAYAGGTRAAEAYLWLRRYTLKGIKGILTENELYAITDSLNGSIMEPQFIVNQSAVIAHIEDADQFEGLGKKWDIDINALIEKLKSMSPADLYFLHDEIDRFWNIPGAYGSPNPELGKLKEFFC